MNIFKKGMKRKRAVKGSKEETGVKREDGSKEELKVKRKDENKEGG
jgi:hypothetical protein